MPGDRLFRILSALGRATDERSGAHRLCEVAVALAGADGGGIMLLAGELGQGALGSTDSVATIVDDLQYTLGEGPAVDAHLLGRPVLEANLAQPDLPRWPAFAPAAVAAGAGAVFGFPVRLGAARLGALSLYRCRPGTLDSEQHADSLVMADVTARALLAIQANAAPGTLAEDLEAAADFQFVVHQASGMVSVQLDVTVAEALVRIRGHAFATGRPIGEVAEDIVARRLRFDRNGAG